ncbi:DUF4351 domain-containing protein [Synechococcus elongatus IITB4]|uniref:DUF4351 domain-containing protein n=1 Tax=Synechococcus elongatus TaxID=32046 RepID=UPI0030D313B2
MPYITSIERISREEGRQEGRAEGFQQGEVAVVLRLLNRRLGQLSPAQTAQIQGLALEQVEELSESLLDFESIADLENWFSRQ